MFQPSENVQIRYVLPYEVEDLFMFNPSDRLLKTSHLCTV